MALPVQGWRLLRNVLPEVNRQLADWRSRAERIPNTGLRRQALLSIAHKRFHCEGGAVYGLFADGEQRRRLIRWIVAYQTISDYLDNLCDRAGSQSVRRSRSLHAAMLDALVLGSSSHDYYLSDAEPDGGYLRDLVDACREAARELPGFGDVAAAAREWAALYADMQVLKHGPLQERQALLEHWCARHAAMAPGLHWYEFSAAAGSTLGIFALLALAANGRVPVELVRRVQDAYMPWVCALHILLDYWIDQEEDRLGGDLNFAAYYRSPAAAIARMRCFMKEARRAVALLPNPALHDAIVRGLPALYLSDGKVLRAGLRRVADPLLAAGGLHARVTYAVCRVRRLYYGADGALQPPPAESCPL